MNQLLQLSPIFHHKSIGHDLTVADCDEKRVRAKAADTYSILQHLNLFGLQRFY